MPLPITNISSLASIRDHHPSALSRMASPPSLAAQPQAPTSAAAQRAEHALVQQVLGGVHSIAYTSLVNNPGSGAKVEPYLVWGNACML